MFASPFEYCTQCKGYVLLDQTQRECAREHQCPDLAKCPLQKFFTGVEFHEGAENAKGRGEPPRA